MEELTYNIEFSHIYSSEGFTEEHERSIEVLQDISEGTTSQKQKAVYTILVDDRTSTPVISLPDIIEKVRCEGAVIDWVALESKFEQCALTLKGTYLQPFVTKKPNKKRGCIEEYCSVGKERVLVARRYNNHIAPTCALLSATWALCRLGCIAPPHGALIQLGQRPFVGKRNITILHKKFLDVESKALSLIRLTPFKEATTRIEYKFYS